MEAATRDVFRKAENSTNLAGHRPARVAGSPWGGRTAPKKPSPRGEGGQRRNVRSGDDRMRCFLQLSGLPKEEKY